MFCKQIFIIEIKTIKNCAKCFIEGKQNLWHSFQPQQLRNLHRYYL